MLDTTESGIVYIEVVTPHGLPVLGADVHLISGGVSSIGVEDEPGRYHATLQYGSDCLLTVQRYGKEGGFDHRTLRTPLFIRRQEDTHSVRTMQPRADERSKVLFLGEDRGILLLRVELDYLWFTPVGYPPTLHNEVEIIADGEQGWHSVSVALRAAKRHVHITTWIYQPTTELLRLEPLSDPEARVSYTVQSVLEELADSGVLVRLLLWDAPFLPMPREARRAARASSDHFEVMQEANESSLPLLKSDEWPLYNRILGEFQIGSHHQKTIVVDGEVGFCTGMNIKENDWDTSTHALFDARRCRFDRPASFRKSVQECREEADHKPRHDFTARVMGPAVQYLEANFRERWNRLIDRGAPYSESATLMDAPLESATSIKGASQVQVIRTMPEPKAERGILDTYLRAIGAARRLVYIEDQYFRSSHVADALAEAVRAWPDLTLIVVTSRYQANAPVAGGWSWECYERIARRKPGFELYGLRVAAFRATGELVVEEVDNHAKLMIVDDMFVTVGSCNMNDRGFEFEGELNLAIVDAELAREVRLRVFRTHLADDARLTGVLENDVAVWREHAEQNRSYEPNILADPPRSSIFPFVPQPRERTVFGNQVF